MSSAAALIINECQVAEITDYYLAYPWYIYGIFMNSEGNNTDVITV